VKKYKDKARAKIAKDKLTPLQVAGMDYWGIAALCGVDIGPKGESPPDFFYEHIRRDLAREMTDAEVKAARDVLRATLQAAIDGKPEFKGKVVKETPDGRLEIT